MKMFRQKKKQMERKNIAVVEPSRENANIDNEDRCRQY